MCALFFSLNWLCGTILTIFTNQGIDMQSIKIFLQTLHNAQIKSARHTNKYVTSVTDHNSHRESCYKKTVTCVMKLCRNGYENHKYMPHFPTIKNYFHCLNITFLVMTMHRKESLSCKFHNKNFVCISHLPHAWCISHHLPWIQCHTNIHSTGQIT